MKKLLNFLSLPLLAVILLIFSIVLYEKSNLSIPMIFFINLFIVVILLISGILIKKIELIIGSLTYLLLIIILIYQIFNLEKDYKNILNYINNGEELIGYISEFPVIKNKNINFQFKVNGIKFNNETDFKNIKPFQILIKFKNTNNFSIKKGDALIIKDKIKLPKEKFINFKYRQYLFYQGIYGITNTKKENIININDKFKIPILEKISHKTIWNFRAQFLNILKKNLNSDVYAFVLSIFFGIRSEIGEEVYQEFQNTGMLHLLAISGMNITFIGTIILTIFCLFLSKSKAYFISLIVLLFYMLLIIYSASSTRAYIMYLIQGIFFIFGLRTLGLSILSYSGIIMICANPYCIFDLGFQLSFIATAGIFLFSKIIEDLLPLQIPSKIKSIFAVTLSAFSSVFILQWAFFQKIQFFALISSIIIVPLFELLFIFLFIFLIIYYISGLYFIKILIEVPTIIFLKIIHFLNLIEPFTLPKIPVYFSYIWIIMLLIIAYLIIPYLLKKKINIKIAMINK